MKIRKIYGRQIIDSRGMPTLEVCLELDNDAKVVASVPSGTSVGRYEAKELRDQDMQHFDGMGVLQAVHKLDTEITQLLIGREPDSIVMDKALQELDGTPDKSRLGANTVLATSIAIIRAQAYGNGLELYELINTLWAFEKPMMPLCMFNIINGGLHAQDSLCFQECMVMPRGETFQERLEYANQIYHELKKLLHDNHYATAIGDEGGFVPQFPQQGIEKERTALRFLTSAIHASQHPTNLCLDVAASHFYNPKTGCYSVYETDMSKGDLISLYQDLCSQFSLYSLEDGLDQDDWDGWRLLTSILGDTVQLVGDDLFVTNVDRINEGVKQKVANAVLIKPNQVGTVSETIQAIKLCKKNGYKTIVSHRSGETNDTFIADLVVGTCAGQFKAGAPVRGERVAKYNRLLEIEEQLNRKTIK